MREALDHANDGITTGTDWMLNQLVMVAGDVDAADFVAGNKDTESMLGHAYRLTNYFNRYDEAATRLAGLRRSRASRIEVSAQFPPVVYRESQYRELRRHELRSS